MFKRGRRAQATIFIIIGIIIVAAAVIIYLFWPRISQPFQGVSENPESFIEDCLNTELKKNVDLISKQGGLINPVNYVLNNNDKVEYLCYTSEYYLTCYMQRPLLKQNIEDEIKKSIKNKVDSCFSEMKAELEKKGNSVGVNKKDFSVELFPGRIRVAIDSNVVVSSNRETKTYNRINADLRSNLYDLTAIASSITNWEARYGDAETTVYMAYYPSIKVEKVKLNDGSKVYIITDRNTDEVFKFASRSVVFPAGYGG